jgi:hypothetical protein
MTFRLDRPATRRRRVALVAEAEAVAIAVALVVMLVGCLPESAGPAPSSGDRLPPATQMPSPVSTGPTLSPSFVRPTPTPMPSFFSYVVAPGDSLNSIAHRFKTTARSIAFWNRGTYRTLDPDSSRYAPNSIKVGWTLVLIPGVVFDENDLPEPTDASAP